MVTSNAPFRPSPLSFGSPRASPFRRPSTSNSPPQARPSTPGSSPGRGYTPVTSPSKLKESYTVTDEDEVHLSPAQDRSPVPQPRTTREVPLSPTRGATSPDTMMATKATHMMAASSDAAARLSPAQLREIREAFQVLDRDNDGFVDKDDVADVLVNIGQDASALSQFFPPGGRSTINFPTFLNTLSQLLAPLSTQQELLNALAAFDEDDSGQIDVEELRDALMHTVPEDGDQSLTDREIREVLNGFTGRRAFGGKGARGPGGGKRGEVFRYQEFVSGLVGGTETNQSTRRDA
ncbi:putative calmodulin [Aspergillus saccharolyticus JOP 1030-1]|uniref:Putative calmodulin n=1 Tax=Aspergillus saccharolyticus JOP 1030-1 TaxID=1450539 RepID=A0A318ZQX9_9EURO|nr:putative calmodulin [Aspergillus saccharolyticus JOP 1030-1]PYH50011.1 putative calmodulin [Aspergillus saccharolyticus JOP 1030-1]